MTNKYDKTHILRTFLVFCAVLFKYIEMWSYLVSDSFEKSSLLIILILISSIIIFLEMKVSTNTLKRIAVMGMVSAILTVITKSTNYILCFLFLIAFCNIESGDKKFLKSFMYSSIFLFTLTIVLGVIGILPSTVTLRYTNGIYVYRNNLGFYGANSLFLCFFPILVSYIVLYYMNYKNNIKKIIITFVILGLTMAFYKLTDCRAGMLCVLFSLVMCNMNRIYKTNILKFFTKYYFVVCLLLGLIMSKYFGNTTNNTVNQLSSGRMYYWNYYVENVGVSLFGREQISRIPLDNLYLYYMYICGGICYIIVTTISIVSSKYILKDHKTMFLVLAFGVYSFFENNISFNLNFMLVLQMLYIINDGKGMSLIKGDEENVEKTTNKKS